MEAQQDIKDSISLLIDKTPSRSNAIKLEYIRKMKSLEDTIEDKDAEKSKKVVEMPLPQLKTAVNKAYDELAGEIQQLIYNHNEEEMPTIKQEFGNKSHHELVSATKRQLSVDLMSSSGKKGTLKDTKKNQIIKSSALAQKVNMAGAQTKTSKENDRLSLIERQEYLIKFNKEMLMKAVTINQNQHNYLTHQN